MLLNPRMHIKGNCIKKYSIMAIKEGAKNVVFIINSKLRHTRNRGSVELPGLSSPEIGFALYELWRKINKIKDVKLEIFASREN